MNKLTRRRKNFLPTLIVNLVFWLAWLFVFLKLSPDFILAFILFYLFLFLAIFLSLAIIIGHSRRGFIATVGVIGALFLKQFQLASVTNLVLLASLLTVLELYISKN
jgi:hypothetical protein